MPPIGPVYKDVEYETNRGNVLTLKVRVVETHLGVFRSPDYEEEWYIVTHFPTKCYVASFRQESTAVRFSETLSKALGHVLEHKDRKWLQERAPPRVVGWVKDCDRDSKCHELELVK